MFAEVSESKFKRIAEYLDEVRLLGAGLFCLALGIFLGNALIAAGHTLSAVGVGMALFRRQGLKERAAAMPASAKWLVVFSLVAVVSVLANWGEIDSQFGYIKKVRYYFIYAAILLVPDVCAELLRAPRWRNSYVLAWLVPMVLAAIVGTIAVIRLDHPFADLPTGRVERHAGLQGEVMTFAYGLQFSVIALTVLLFVPSIWKALTRISWRWVIPFALIAGSSMYLTYSRGAMLGVVVGLTMFAMMKSRWLVIAVLAVGLVGGGVAALEGARYFQFEESVRKNQWEAAGLAFLENPGFGLGFRNFEAQSVALKERYGLEKDIIGGVSGESVPRYFNGHAHNNYLEAFASTGVLGGLSFLAFCASWLWESWRSPYAMLFVPLIAAFLVSGFFENTFFDSEVLNAVLLIYLCSQASRFAGKESKPRTT